MAEVKDKTPLELGTKPIGSLLKQYALPAIIAMTASSLYNIVDSIFIGQGVGALAISGLAVTFPFMNLSAAFGAMVGVGGSALISMLLGQKNYQIAKQVLGNVFWLNVIIGILFTFFGLIYLDPILRFFGASDNTLPYAHEYIEIILWGNVVTHLYFGLNSVLRAAGHPYKSLTATVIAVCLNAILDPIFIFWFKMGIRGAAIATIIAQIVTLMWQMNTFSDKRELIRFERKSMGISLRIVRDCLAIGASPFFMNAAGCLVTLIINQQFLKYGGDLAVGAYGIANRFAFVFFMIGMGLNQGMQPIAGYNYGAGKIDRVMRVFKLTVLSSTVIFTLCFLVGELAPRLVVKLFTSDEELIEKSIIGIRIVVALFPILPFQIVCAQLFQSLGLAGKAIFLSLSRQILFLIPLLLILPEYIGIKGVWWSMPISDFITSFTSLILFIIFKKETAKNTLSCITQ